MIPDRFIRILRSSENDTNARFPPTEVFNEGWMLRLVLDAIQSAEPESPLRFENGAVWYSEALLSSPFGARHRADALAEGFTNADGAIGQFAFRPNTRTGLELAQDATQFTIIEAKMFSNLSSGTRNARNYNQAARNVACMATAIARANRTPGSFASVGFFVAAPERAKRRPGVSNLEESVDPVRIRAAVHERIRAYEEGKREEAISLRAWEAEYFLPLVDLLEARGCLRVLTWESCIDAISGADGQAGKELEQFYERCLSFVGTTPEPRG